MEIRPSGSHHLPALLPAESREELLETCLENIPGQLAADVRAETERNRRRYNYLQIFLVILALAAGFFLLYRLFPDTSIKIVESGALEIADESGSFPRGSIYYREFASGVELYNDKKYDECFRLLSPLSEKVWNELGGEGGKWYFLYLDSARRGTVSAADREKAREFAIKLREAFPDSIEFRLFEIALTPERYLNYAALPERVRVIPGVYFRRIDELEKKYDAMEIKAEDNRRRLELLRAKLLLSSFVAQGRPLDYPDDDLESPGVAEREEALRIARRYPDSREAWEMRKFIAETILEHSNAGNLYYWDGVTRFLEKPLHDEAAAAKKILEEKK